MLPVRIGHLPQFVWCRVGLKDHSALFPESRLDSRQRHMFPPFHFVCDARVHWDHCREASAGHAFKSFFLESSVVTAMVADLVEDGALEQVGGGHFTLLAVPVF